ncbi:hypothetical protein MJO28_011366, partial [Puccinia striiformis f. sp. tritici]
MSSNRCVTCGIPVKYLYTKYGQDNFVLEICVSCSAVFPSFRINYGNRPVSSVCFCTTCTSTCLFSNCKKFTDPYIEQSSIILILDLFLLKPQVYYHLLYNSNYSFQSFNSQVSQPAVPPTTSSQEGSDKSKSEDTTHKNLKAFSRAHFEYSFLIYLSILVVESSLQALDDSHPDDSFLHSNSVKRILIKLLSLVFHIFNLVSTATAISRLIGYGASYQRINPIREDIINSIKAIIISLSPGIVLYFTIMIFQNSYGTRPPPPLFSPAESGHWSDVQHFIKTRFGYNISGMFDGLVGIDMDQLGSTKLKQFLIRNFMGSLRCSVGIAVSYGQPWTFGFVVVTCCFIQERLLAHLPHQMNFLLP